jgi:paraquat-inducible protein B
MSERTHEHERPHGLPKAKVERSYLTWSLWLFPVIAAAIVGYFVVYDMFLSGPTVTVYFQNAEGLQEKNTVVKYRGINVGQVYSIKLVDNGTRVAVSLKLDSDDLARPGSVFWIVHPEVKVGSISGLRTIVSGNYVAVQPGSGQGTTNKFIGEENAPIQPEPGINIILLADDLGSLEKQSQIFYRGVEVGEVTDFKLSDDAQHIVINARIRDQYAPLVRVNTQFWNAGGINVHAGLFSGLQISAESAQTVVSGGIAFSTPDDFGPPATNGTVFVLASKEDDDWKNWSPKIPLNAPPQAQRGKNAMQEINK